MDMPTLKRIMKLAANLSANPRYIPRYLYHLHKNPLDIGLPWFSYAAIEFLERHLKPHMTVFEYGAGGSTVFFSERTARVVSREPDGTWRSRTELALPRTANVEFISRGHVESPFDVIVIDHSEARFSKISREDRAETFEKVERFAAHGGIIIMDDSWRHTGLREGRNVTIFEGVGPCRRGVTSTDVYFY